MGTPGEGYGGQKFSRHTQSYLPPPTRHTRRARALPLALLSPRPPSLIRVSRPSVLLSLLTPRPFRLTFATTQPLTLPRPPFARTLPPCFSLLLYTSLSLSFPFSLFLFSSPFSGILRSLPPPTIDVPRLSNHCARTDNSNGACYVLVGRRRRWWTHGRPTTTKTTAATSTSPRTSVADCQRSSPRDGEE